MKIKTFSEQSWMDVILKKKKKVCEWFIKKSDRKQLEKMI